MSDVIEGQMLTVNGTAEPLAPTVAALLAARDIAPEGRGVAVVAGEVRRLAETSQASAKEIRDLAASSVHVADSAGLVLDEIKVLRSASPGDPAAIERLREVASRKLPEVVALIERSELVRDWLELAARCECPDLAQCTLFDDAALPGGSDAKRPPARTGLSATCRFRAGRTRVPHSLPGRDG